MNRLPIYIMDPDGAASNPEDKLVFSWAEYEEFVEATKEAGAFAVFSKDISLRCEICRSYRPFRICNTTRNRDTGALELDNTVWGEIWRNRNPNRRE